MNNDDDKHYDIMYDTAGNEVKVLKQRIDPEPLDSSKFTYYDNSHGHCGLCGKITCNGQCFK